MNTNKVGAYLGSGGNKAFFVNGALSELHKNEFHLDHLSGFSSASAIMFAHKFGCHEEVLKLFSKRLSKNESNFNLGITRAGIFPQSDIYKNSIQEMFERFSDQDNPDISFEIVASHTTPRSLKVLDSYIGLNVLHAMASKEKEIERIKKLNKKFDINPIYFSSQDNLGKKDLISVIMGTSSIYPFIDLHYLNNRLLLEGKLALVDPSDMLKGFGKQIMVLTRQGKTEVKDNVLYIRSKNPIPNNVLDYTSEKPIQTLHFHGQEIVKDNLELIGNYFN
jgi:predicted patatin/cPLA2 family phospholipase